MPNICAVATCTTRGGQPKGGEVSFFRFPKDPEMRGIWVQRCQRLDLFDPGQTRICSRHFTEADYDPSYLMKLSLMPSMGSHGFLKADAVPSLCLPSAATFDGRKAARGEAPQEAESGPDDPAERRRRSQQLRRERHERKERKELVEQLLAEHDRNQQEAAAAAAAETPSLWRPRAQVQAIVLNPEDDTRKTSVASEADADTDIDPEAEVEADADDEVEVKVPPTDSPAAEDPAGDSQSPSGGVRHSGPSVVTICVRPLTKRPSLMVERTKKILRLKLRVRKLEAKCLRVLGATGAPSSDTQDTGGGVEGRGAADEGEGQAENTERPQVNPAPAAGEMPLVVLRDEKLPAILTQLRQTRQSDGLSMLTPSGLREAQEINHQLKVQMLGLQASVLKWVIKNKRMRDARLRKAREGGEKHQRTVRAVRLRQLLRLESAVKAMFSEAQIRAMTRQHGYDSIPPSKRKGRSHWSDEDLRRVLELRAISSDRVVEHVRDKMKIPLPSMQTTRKRCYKSPALNDVYREIMQKNEDNRKLCAMCERQVTTIDQVVEAAADEVSDDSATYGRQFVQHVPSPSPPRSPDQPATLSRPRKRRRAPAAAPVRTRKKVRTQAVASHDWEETDSASELSDPGLWDRLGSSALDAVPGELSGRLDDHLRRQPPDPYTGMRKSWR